MKVLIFGGRDFKDVDRLYHSMSRFVVQNGNVSRVVSGHARGADEMGEMWADEMDLPVDIFPADWEKFGKRAGYLRNVQMADSGLDYAVEFPGGKGTAMMHHLLIERKIPIFIG